MAKRHSCGSRNFPQFSLEHCLREAVAGHCARPSLAVPPKILLALHKGQHRLHTKTPCKPRASLTHTHSETNNMVQIRLLIRLGAAAFMLQTSSAQAAPSSELRQVLRDVSAWIPGNYDSMPQIAYERTNGAPPDGEHSHQYRVFARIDAPHLGEYVILFSNTGWRFRRTDHSTSRFPGRNR